MNDKWKFWQTWDSNMGWQPSTTKFDREIIEKLYTSKRHFQIKINKYHYELKNFNSLLEDSEFNLVFLEETKNAKDNQLKKKAHEQLTNSLQKNIKKITEKKEEFQKQLNIIKTIKNDICTIKENNKSNIPETLDVLIIHGDKAVKRANKLIEKISKYLEDGYP